MRKGRGKIWIMRAENKQYYFTVKARNGKTLATSEMYNSKQACRKGAISLVTHQFLI